MLLSAHVLGVTQNVFNESSYLARKPGSGALGRPRPFLMEIGTKQAYRCKIFWSWAECISILAPTDPF